MTDVAVMFALPRNMGDGSQLTRLNGTVVLTVTGSPFAAALGSGVTVISLSFTVIFPLVR